MAHVGAQDFDHRLSVEQRVPRNPFQRVDAAEAHVDLVASELVDRSCEPACELVVLAHLDLLLIEPKLSLAELDLTPREEGGGQEEDGSEPLQQRRTDLVAGIDEFRGLELAGWPRPQVTLD